MRDGMKRRYIFCVFWIMMFVAICLVLTQTGYSDGDDAWFYQYTDQMGFFEYLSWRYETWVGRMAGEALVYLAFSLGLPFWRVVNAMMLVLLTAGILRLAATAAYVTEAGVAEWDERRPALAEQDYREMGLLAAAAGASGFLLMSVETLGYAAVWVNGSIFYTWTFTCGTWALVPFAELVFKGKAEGWKFMCALLPAVIASMSVEQMGAVLFAFELLALGYSVYRDCRVNVFALVQTLVTALAFGILFAAPGNALRVQSEIATWMPGYETISFGHHLFITVQWLLSSFANENKLFLCGIWTAGILLLCQRTRKGTAEYFLLGGAGIFTMVSLLPFAGITVFSDLGMGISDITVRLDHVPVWSDLAGIHVFALVWWTVALVFTFFFVWKVSGGQMVLVLAYLAGIASEAILFFSPTMYASGARVYYLTDLLYLFILLALSFGVREGRRRGLFYAGMLLAGLINFAAQMPVLRAFIDF